ncbi:heterokaryon incompatibility protein-domain-containing protein, partial [Podospora australis]
MWLIETYTWKLRFFHNPPEKYAILSHAWAEEELTFQEFRSLEGVGGALAEQEARRIRNKKGFKKIQQCCHLALSNNLRLAWVDTCCIDKASSAELSESINSMFHWYKESTICYVYLEDVTSVSVTTKPNEADPYKPDEPSRWYTRGWTLQELLAPARVDFYNSSWQKIGSKWGLRKEIASITGIGELDLISYDRSRTSIAQKMSWASRRNTTRIEDAAYCLLGIFGIHMPLLYGERGNAFRRLQERLIQTSSDQSIFCWNNTSYVRAPDAGEPWGMLAGSPRDF